MAVHVEFETLNAAFSDGNEICEIQRIMSVIVDKMSQGKYEAPIHDVNGNKIGSWSFSD